MTEYTEPTDRELIDAVNLIAEFVEHRLPIGYDISLSLSSAEASLSLTSPEGSNLDFTPDGDRSSLREACDVAKEREELRTAWESIDEMTQAYAVFAGEGDDGCQMPVAILRTEDAAKSFAELAASAPEINQVYQVMPIRQVKGEFWNSYEPVQW